MPRSPAPAGTCTGPGPCRHPARARGLCTGHLAQIERGQDLHPLRPRSATPLVVASVRVPAPVRDRIQADPAGARDALARWARG